MIYKIFAPLSRFFTAAGVFFYCNALPLKADVPEPPPPPIRFADGTAISGPALAAILLGLILLTAGIFYILHTKYGHSSAAPVGAETPAAASPAKAVPSGSPVQVPVPEEAMAPAK